MVMNLALSDIPYARPDGSQERLRDHLGKVVLIVNTASKCGLTPQFASLDRLYRDKRAAGLLVLGFPSGDFMEQEFDSDEEIAAFCSGVYDVSFPMLAKTSVAGDGGHPLFHALTRAVPHAIGADEFRDLMRKHKLELAPSPGVLWNFEKFLIGRDGKVAMRFAPHIAVDDERVCLAIEVELAKE